MEDYIPDYLSNEEQVINPKQDPNVFWVSFEEAMSTFACLNVCRAINMYEVRLRGKFIRLQDIHQADISQVVSKWYYSIDIQQKTRVYITLH